MCSMSSSVWEDTVTDTHTSNVGMLNDTKRIGEIFTNQTHNM